MSKHQPNRQPVDRHIEIIDMTEEPAIELSTERGNADGLMEKYLALHDLRFRAGDIEFLPKADDKVLRDKVAARAEEVMRSVDSILRSKARGTWPRPTGS